MDAFLRERGLDLQISGAKVEVMLITVRSAPGRERPQAAERGDEAIDDGEFTKQTHLSIR